MGRVLAIDFGRKRCGIAVTDPLRIAGNGLCTVDTAQLPSWVADYVAKENVDIIVVGEPKALDGTPSDSTRYIEPALGRLRAAIPESIEIVSYDERFTSVLAHQAMLDGGLHRMDRRQKPLVDTIAAAIILNDYLSSRQYRDTQP